MAATYSYDPALIPDGGVDKMRFELGDTEVIEGPLTSALSDEEYSAILALHPDSWKRAKLACLESIYRRFAYEPDTTEGPVSFQLHERAKLWKQMYDDLLSEINSINMLPRAHISGKPPYFRTDLHRNFEGGGRHD